MIAYGENIQVFCGNSNPQFAQTICKELGVPMGKAIVTHFADGEASVTLEETVRGADVFLIQSTCKPVNDNLMELLVMIDACRRASAGRITAVIPYFGYARQDRKAKSRDRQAGGQHAHRRRCQPHSDHGSPRRPDSGLLRHSSGSPAGQRYLR